MKALFFFYLSQQNLLFNNMVNNPTFKLDEINNIESYKTQKLITYCSLCTTRVTTDWHNNKKCWKINSAHSRIHKIWRLVNHVCLLYFKNINMNQSVLIEKTSVDLISPNISQLCGWYVWMSEFMTPNMIHMVTWSIIKIL